MPTNEELIPTKAEIFAARNAADGAVWSVLYAGLALEGFAHDVGDPEESNWQFDKFGIEAEATFRRMIERRDALDELIPDRLLTAVEEAKARAGDPMPVSVGNLQFPTYHRAAMIRLRRFVMMLSIGSPLPWPPWVYELVRERPGRPANAAERHAYYKSLLEGLMSFPLGSNVEEMETGIRCECARALAAAPDSESVAAVDEVEIWHNAAWYKAATGGDLYPGLLRRAAGDGRIAGRKPGKRNEYELGSVCVAYEQYRDLLQTATKAHRKAHQSAPSAPMRTS